MQAPGDISCNIDFSVTGDRKFGVNPYAVYYLDAQRQVRIFSDGIGKQRVFLFFFFFSFLILIRLCVWCKRNGDAATSWLLAANRMASDGPELLHSGLVCLKIDDTHLSLVDNFLRDVTKHSSHSCLQKITAPILPRTSRCCCCASHDYRGSGASKEGSWGGDQSQFPNQR